MNYILFDGEVRDALLPLTYTRPVADLRIGILTLREKWEYFLGLTTTTVTESYLESKFPMVEMDANIMINSAIIPTQSLVDTLKELKENQLVLYKDRIVAFFSTASQEEVDIDSYESIVFEAEELLVVEKLSDIFSFNDQAIRSDFEILSESRESQDIPDTVNCIGKENIFIEQGAKISFATINAQSGPVYIGKDAEIMEGALIRGPFALCDHGVVKMGAKIYGATTIGPYSKVGGEVNNSVIFGYSNKGHDGFLGNAVIGQWCNLGADTNNSNLKNNYAQVKLWNYEQERFVKTGLQFCGLIMGDHSKSGINTMFNTGTVIGVNCNIYGGNFPRNFIPSFSWGGSAGFTVYQLNKTHQVAKIVMKRRNLEYTDQDQQIMEVIFEQSKKYRNFE